MGDPGLEETDIGPIGKHESLDIATYEVQEALERGGRLLIGGRSDGSFFYPTLIEFEKEQILGAREDEKPFLWIEESFAPVRSFVVFDTIEEAVALANDSPYGLGASVFGGEGAGGGHRSTSRGRADHDQRGAPLQRHLPADRRDPRQRRERLDRQDRGDGLYQAGPPRDLRGDR